MRGEILYPGDLSYFFLLSYCFPVWTVLFCAVCFCMPALQTRSPVRLCQQFVLGRWYTVRVFSRNRWTKFCLLLTCLSETLRWTLNPSCHRPSDKQSVRQSSLVTFSVLCEVLNSFHSCFPVFSTTFPRVRNAASVEPVVQLAQSADTEIQVQITLLRSSREYILSFSCTTGSSSSSSSRFKVDDIFECGIFVVLIIAMFSKSYYFPYMASFQYWALFALNPRSKSDRACFLPLC
ncbi:hypothetical protein T07_4961 [Trichinella nelsoni]|uniref:Uncharacterized protein n=1 Tax=Trichinella nelsoni TaxID=6336 RepID=A0A0V0SK08_9BILA|nr:hypothetical protein T07_4961 [Trichinella nelsoni]